MKILPLALTLLNGTARTQLTGLTTRARTLALVGSLAAISAIFLLIALTIVLAAEVGIVGACLVMSAVFGLAALLILWRASRARQRRVAANAQKIAVASSADTSAGATGLLLAQAFAKGFLNRRL